MKYPPRVINLAVSALEKKTQERNGIIAGRGDFYWREPSGGGTLPSPMRFGGAFGTKKQSIWVFHHITYGLTLVSGDKRSFSDGAGLLS